MLFFFFKQKTAYEMRISDWSSDVCSSDLDVRVMLRDNRVRYDSVERRGDNAIVARLATADAADKALALAAKNLPNLQAEANEGTLVLRVPEAEVAQITTDRKSTRLNSSH